MAQVVISMHDEAHAEIHHFVTQANKSKTEFKFRHILLSKTEQRGLANKRVYGPRACDKAYRLRAAHGLHADDIFIVVLDGKLYDDEDEEYFLVTGSDYCLEDTQPLPVAIISRYYLNPCSAFMEEVQAGWKNLPEIEIRRKLSDSIVLLLLSCVTAELTSLQYHEESQGCIMDYCQTPSDLLEALNSGLQFCPQCLKALESGPAGSAVLAVFQQLERNPYRQTRDTTPLAPIPEAVVTLDWRGVKTHWEKAVQRVHRDPASAITHARCLLESVCIKILEERNLAVEHKGNLLKLYEGASAALKLSPNQQADEAIAQLTKGCVTVAGRIAEIRNKLSDSHAHPDADGDPDTRHAMLAVNAACTVALFLIESHRASWSMSQMPNSSGNASAQKTGGG